MTKLIETHCHFDMIKQNTQEVLDKAKLAGVEKFITISVSPKTLDTVIDLCQNHEDVYGTQGIHPHEAKDFNQDVRERIKKNVTTQEKILAIGEIGLDYHYNHSEKNKQIQAFESQLELASELSYPVVIHSRDADEDTISVLKNFSSKLSKKGVIHSFTSGKDLAEFALSEGFYLGFNGIMTFKNAQNVRDIFAITPIERLLCETDSPFLAPVPHRGKENTPIFLPFVVEKMASEKNMDVDELSETLYQNAINLFQIKS